MAVNVVLKSVWDDKGIKNATKAFDVFGKSLGRIGGLVAGAFSVGALVNFSRAAAEDAKSQALLAEQLRNTVGANEEMIASVEDSISRMQTSAAVADDVLRPAFGQLVRATGDVGQATRLMDIALDVSAATGRDLSSVTVALSKAYQGNTSALSRLGIKAEEGTDVFAMLEEQFAGAAETAARNDPFQRLTIIFGELEEQIGQMFLPYLNEIADYFASADFATAFASMAASIGEAIKQIDALFRQLTGSTALTFFINLIDAAAVGLAEIAFVAGDAAKTIGMIFSGDFAGAGRQFSTFLTRYNAFVQEIYRKQDEAKARANKQQKSGSSFIPTLTPTTKKGKADTKKESDKAAEEQREALAKARKLIDDANKQLAEMQAELASTLAQINADYAKEVAAVNKDFAKRLNDIVQQSQNRLRDAYRSVVSVSISDLFGERTTQKVKTEISKLVGNIRTTITRETEETVGGSVNDLVAGLTKRLTDSKALLENASLLASRGFSQTFIEQVVGAGTETGNELAKAILEATPQTQEELRNLFNAVETQANNGMDVLAKSIYDKAGLATQELKDLYTATQQEQVDALLALQEELQKNLADANLAFQKSVAELREKLKEDLEAIKGDLSSLKAEIDSLMAKLAELAGMDATAPSVNIPTTSPVIPKVPAPTKKPVGTTINVITKTDPTKSAAETGKQIAKAVNKYTGGGGGVRTGFIAL
jgi:DNA-directed RNA polymerase subunit F